MIGARQLNYTQQSQTKRWNMLTDNALTATGGISIAAYGLYIAKYGGLEMALISELGLFQQ